MDEIDKVSMGKSISPRGRPQVAEGLKTRIHLNFASGFDKANIGQA